MHLQLPTIRYEKSYLAAVDEAVGETQLTKIKTPEPGESFEDFVNTRIAYSRGEQLPEGYVPNTELWLIDNDEFIGWTNIRHRLNESLQERGGNIGYWIRPSRRNEGYGKEILRLALMKARELGISKALLTCLTSNTASCKIIEANGGVLENIVGERRYYWIDLEEKSK